MTLDEILSEWTEDCGNFNPSDLSEEQTKAIKLHAKYTRFRALEGTDLRSLKIAYQKLRAEKEDFVQNPTVEVMKEKGWVIPPKGKITKLELATYLSKDSDLIKCELAIGRQEEKVEALKEIIRQINQRTYSIRNILEDRKFNNGG